MEATIRMTYEMTIIKDGYTAEELTDYIQENIYRCLDIGLGLADEYDDPQIDIDEDDED
tara:strand:- start:30 stop:206 length:177 start_codon:yes stop_codon:yes gene_type:complete